MTLIDFVTTRIVGHYNSIIALINRHSCRV